MFATKKHSIANRSTYQPSFLIRTYHGKEAKGSEEDKKDREAQDDKEAQSEEASLVFLQNKIARHSTGDFVFRASSRAI